MMLSIIIYLLRLNSSNATFLSDNCLKCNVYKNGVSYVDHT